MANFWENDEVVELVVQPEVTVEAPKAETTGTNFWDKDTVVGLIDLATTPQEPAPVSEDPDRQFFQSGVPEEQRMPEPESTQDFDTTIMSFVEQNEGRKNVPYQDTKGLWTVGVGHLLGKTLPPAYKNPDGTPRTLTDQEVQGLFETDYAKHKAEAAQLPMFSELDNLGQQALIDLTFNMGPTKFNEKKWPKFFTALKNKDLDTAAKELKNSKWFNEVASRAPKVINLIEGASFN